jgi:glucokinase
MLEELLKKPVYLENDANAAALGEAVAGCGNGVPSFIAITLGTGVGSGIVLDGKVYRGSNFCGGEMGHTVICVDGIPCNCGRKGCWEKYASATALVSQAVEAMQGNKGSLLWQTCDGDLNKVDGRSIFEAYDMGDAVAKAVVDKYLYYVSVGLSNVINALQPDTVCIGGGISGQGEKILKPIRDMVKAERYSVYADKQTSIVPAELGNDAGIIGAALLGE